MASVLWRGSVATQVRIGSGLVLMLYVTLHLLNVASVLISPAFADAFQTVRLAVTRSPPGMIVLTAALFAHLILSLYKIATRRTFRMAPVEAIQIVFGLTIPLILSSHIIYTIGAHNALGVDTRLGYLTSLIWDSTDGWLQVVLVGVTWVHGAIGLHMWLRLRSWWTRATNWLVGVAVLIPTLAVLGFVTSGRAMKHVLSDPDRRTMAFEAWNFPDQEGFALLGRIDTQVDRIMWIILAGLAGFVALRWVVATIRKPVRITYVNGPTVRAARGPTLLETSRMSGVDHTALCGGRGRCTTCRVIVEEGLEDLPAPSAAEKKALVAVDAPPNARLACQLRPQGPLTVFRVFGADGKRKRAHASQGKEARLAVLFLDMRGFTARTEGQLPYDVVFLLNRFFDKIVPPIVAAKGTVDKYMGDGLMAVFETPDAASSARGAIEAIAGIGAALQSFNDTLKEEGGAPVSIGIGVHLGTVVLGEIGAAGSAPRTLIGDTVNIASRLESHTKDHGVQAILSVDVLDAAGIAGVEEQLVSLTLRGREAPLRALALARATDAERLIALPS